MNKDLPSIFAFPRGKHSWRIDWFGELAFPNRFERRTQPSVLVHLSRVAVDDFHANPSSLLQPESTLTAWQRKMWVSIGALPLLRVGDIWLDGRFELAPDYEFEQFEDVEIKVPRTGTSVAIVPCGRANRRSSILVAHSIESLNRCSRCNSESDRRVQ